jgi:hypothetical protein
MTEQWVARVVRCHIAWHEVVGPHTADALEDPFLVGTPEITFGEVETGFVVRIAGVDKTDGKEILRRALLLAGPSTPL